VGIIENDSQVECHDGSRRKPSHDNKNYLHIEIFEYID